MEITGTTNEMQTFLIAQALVPSESTDAVLWVFEQVIHKSRTNLIGSSMKRYSMVEGSFLLSFSPMPPRRFPQR